MSHSVREKKVLKVLKKQDVNKLIDIQTKQQDIPSKKEATLALGKLALQKNQTDENKNKILQTLYSSFKDHRENKIVRYASIRALHDIAKFELGKPESTLGKEILQNFEGSFQSKDNEIKTRSIAAVASLTSPKHVTKIYNQATRAPVDKKTIDKSIMLVGIARGLLITISNDWSQINDNLKNKGYTPKTRDVDVDAAKKLSLDKYFPIKGYKKTVGLSPDGKTEYCWVDIELKTRSMSKQEIDYYVKDLTKTVGVAALDPVVKWFDTVKTQKTTFDFIQFKLLGRFDVLAYRAIQKNNPTAKLPDVNRELASKFCELLAEKKIYSDIYDAFSAAAGALTSPVLNYFSKKWPLAISGQVLRLDDKCRVGEKIRVLLIIENKMKNSTLLMDRDFKLVVQSNYFDCSPPTLIGILRHNEPYYCVVDLIPKITDIIKDDIKYPISFQLVEPVNNTVLKECKLRLSLGPPELEISGTRSFLPYTGSQMTATLNVVLRSNFDGVEIEGLPIQVSCNSDPDFKNLNTTAGAKKGIRVSKEPNQATFVLQPNRAGFLGYLNRVSFEFYLGGRTDPFACHTLEMTVLPNLLDTAIAGGTVFVGVLSQLVPALVPPIGANLNFTTVGSSAALIYLGFRAFTWGLNTQKMKP
jgi:hypothetical protein